MNSADITRPPDEAVEKVFYFVLTFIMRFCIIIKHIWARSSAGRAPRSQRGGREFDPLRVHHIRTVILIQCVSKLPSLFCTPQPSKGLGFKAFWRLFYFLPFAVCKRKHPSAERVGNICLALCKRVLWICTRCSPCKREHLGSH